MMISPETYYELNLKNKTQQEILKEIRSLKREIRSLKRDIEENWFSPEQIYPARLTRLKCNCRYLERALQAYQDAAGEYILTKAEQKSQDFDSKLSSLQKLVCTVSGFFSGHETRTYTVTGDQAVLDPEETWSMDPEVFLKPRTVGKDEFIAGLKELHIGEWKRKYNDPGTLDGTQWELEIYCDDRKPVKISGSNAYPYNFRDLMNLLEIDWENEVYEEDQD